MTVARRGSLFKDRFVEIEVPEIRPRVVQRGGAGVVDSARRAR